MKNTKTHATRWLLGLCLSAPLAQAAVVVDYNGFADLSGLTTIGSATTALTADGTVLRLTPASSNKTGAAYSTSAVTLGVNATFSTTFQFRFTSAGGWDPADGIVFVLAASTSGIGSAGVGMGYSGVGNSVGIEFDTYNNAGYNLGNNDGNSSNHVSIDTNGVLSNTALTNVYGNGSCGFTNGTPRQNDHTVDGCMSNGHLWSVAIAYDGQFLSVDLTDPAKGTVFHAIQDHAIDIAGVLGTNQAYVGFTSGTGAGWQNHDIVNWQFARTLELVEPLNTVPEPGSLALLGAGLGLLGWSQMKKRFGHSAHERANKAG
ncbi:MAG: hypothetical protein RJA09_2168 [Pseudomonadota bacterium]|jgi:hypothetical protein